MRFVVADWETFFSKDYTLSRLSTEAYVRDRRFQAHGVAIKWSPETPARWYDERQARFILAQEDWSDTLVIHHHAQFDGLIESHHYNVRPAMFGCTLAMARLVLGNHVSASLDGVRKHFGMFPKTTPYHNFIGRHWDELTPAVQQQLAAGAIDETESIWRIFCKFMAMGFPREELGVIDTTIKMFTEPVLCADTDMLARIWEHEETSKAGRLEALGIGGAELRSSDKFAELLRAEGIEPEQKDGKNGKIWAFAKTDEFMRGLVEHDSERVRLLAQARLGEKSTLMQTRAETLGWMSQRGAMPVYLSYCGAHTRRWAGSDGANWQNFKRGSDLRKAIMAPNGYLLAPIDLSQVECRVLNYLAGEEHVLSAFRDGRDLYRERAAQHYAIGFAEVSKTQRHVAKVLELGCGYGMGATKLQTTLRLGALGGPTIRLTDAEADHAIRSYRGSHPGVTRYWSQAGRLIARLAGGAPIDWGPMHLADGKIYAPNGLWLDYTTLEFYNDIESGERYWRHKTRQGWAKLYSGKLVENVVQWLSRIVLSQAMLRIAKAGFKIALCTHDEALVVIRDDAHKNEALEFCAAEMRRTPDWLPGLPLACEASLSERYAK